MAKMCIASNSWKEANPQLVDSLSSALLPSAYRLRFSSISPDFIFNQSGVSVAFIVVLAWEQIITPLAWDRKDRLAKMDNNFQRSYFLASAELCLDDKFLDLFYKHRKRKWKGLLLPVPNWDKALEEMLKLANLHAESRQQESTETSAVIEQLEFVSSAEAVTPALCAIPGLDVHDAHSLMLGIGSVEAIARSSTNSILRLTDLSKEKAQAVEDFFGNEDYNRTPVLE